MQNRLQRFGVHVVPAAAIAATVALFIAPALAAAPSQPRQAAAQIARKPGQVRGELTRVNARAKTITIREDNGAVMKFRYTDDTKVTGAETNIAGLAGDKGERVTVHYEIDKQHDGRMLAFVVTRLDVHPAKR